VFTVTIVVVSRLVYRKGVDLLAQIIADVCLKNQKVFVYKSILTLLYYALINDVGSIYYWW